MLLEARNDPNMKVHLEAAYTMQAMANKKEYTVKCLENGHLVKNDL
jgi:hypothetical protein